MPNVYGYGRERKGKGCAAAQYSMCSLISGSGAAHTRLEVTNLHREMGKSMKGEQEANQQIQFRLKPPTLPALAVAMAAIEREREGSINSHAATRAPEGMHLRLPENDDDYCQSISVCKRIGKKTTDIAK